LTESAEVQTPYFAGSLLACARMVLVAFGRIATEITEAQLLMPWVPGNIPPEEATPDNLASRELILTVIQSYGVPCRMRSHGKLVDLTEAFRHGRQIIAFLADRQPALSPKDRSYGVVVTAVASRRFRVSAVTFHDPRAGRGGAGCQLHGSQFVGKWTAAATPLAFNYLTMKIPDATKRDPRAFIECWQAP
jgi:hypothetical protein